MTLAINEVISVCSSKDLSVWKLTSTYLIKYIKADRYSLFVPDSEVSIFRDVTHPCIQVYPESKIVGELRSDLLEHLEGENKNRIGWYLQQFIKIGAIFRLPSDEIALIWDADTIPLKTLNFVADDNTILFYTGTEYRASYFHFIKKVYCLNKIVKPSFIAQCMPVKVRWVKEMADELEAKFHVNWLWAMLKQIEPREPAGFSEYETIGTYVYAYHQREISFLKGLWCRNGKSLVGNPQSLSSRVLKGLANDFDFISFEQWDQPKGLRRKISALKNRLKYFFSA